MRAYYTEPSCTYTLILSAEDVIRLLSGSTVIAHTPKIQTNTNIVKPNSDPFSIAAEDYRTMDTDGMWLSEYELGGDGAEHYIQFLNVCIEEGALGIAEKKTSDTDEEEK